MKIDMHNNNVWLTCASLQSFMLCQLPVKILQQMHMVDLIGKSDKDIIWSILRARRTVEKREESKCNLMTKAPAQPYMKPEGKDRDNLKVHKMYQKLEDKGFI